MAHRTERMPNRQWRKTFGLAEHVSRPSEIKRTNGISPLDNAQIQVILDVAPALAEDNKNAAIAVLSAMKDTYTQEATNLDQNIAGVRSRLPKAFGWKERRIAARKAPDEQRKQSVTTGLTILDSWIANVQNGNVAPMRFAVVDMVNNAIGRIPKNYLAHAYNANENNDLSYKLTRQEAARDALTHLELLRLITPDDKIQQEIIGPLELSLARLLPKEKVPRPPREPRRRGKQAQSPAPETSK